MLTQSPMGIEPVAHPSGEIRILTLKDGILSGLGSNIFTNTPVKMNTDGTIIPCLTAAADPIMGIFAGCEYSVAGRRFVNPYFPSGTTYDVGSMIAKIVPMDAVAFFEGLTLATVAITARGEGINLGNTVQGSIYTGLSTQSLGAPTGATAASFTIVDLAPYPDNNWGDTWVKLRLKVQTVQGPVA